MTYEALHRALEDLIDKSTEPKFIQALENALLWIELKYDWVDKELS